jgi:hypothetical protein
VPQRDVVINYEIDDYRLKSELTADTLFTCVYATLRTYKALQDLEQKRSLEQLAIDLKQANQRLTIEITERTHTQELADLRMRDLAALNKKLEDSMCNCCNRRRWPRSANWPPAWHTKSTIR